MLLPQATSVLRTDLPALGERRSAHHSRQHPSRPNTQGCRKASARNLILTCASAPKLRPRGKLQRSDASRLDRFQGFRGRRDPVPASVFQSVPTERGGRTAPEGALKGEARWRMWREPSEPKSRAALDAPGPSAVTAYLSRMSGKVPLCGYPTLIDRHRNDLSEIIGSSPQIGLAMRIAGPTASIPGLSRGRNCNPIILRWGCRPPFGTQTPPEVRFAGR